MGANYTPIINPTSQLGSFRFWVQKVLPLVYDDSLSYYELLCKVVDYINKIIENADATNENVHNLYDAYEKLQSYVNNYFVSLDINGEVDKKLDEMVQDGTLEQLVRDATYFKGDIVLISDSYGHPESSGGTSWEQFVKQYMSDRNVLTYYKGGCGFGWGVDNQYYFPNYIKNIPASNEVIQVLMLCGANDGNILNDKLGTEADIENGIAETASLLKTKFPNAKISIGFVGRYKNGREIYYYNACEVYKKCTKYGICFANGFQYVLHNRDLIADSNVHPSLAGSERIAHYAVEYLMSGNIYVTDFRGFKDATSNYYVQTDGDTTTFQFDNQNANGKTIDIEDQQVSIGSVIILGKLVDLPDFQPIGNFGAIGASGCLYVGYLKTPSPTQLLSGSFYMVGETVAFRNESIPIDTSNVGVVILRHFKITCPTMFC